MGRLLTLMAERIGVERMDRIWLFPPLVRGRKEWGLVAVSCHTEAPPQRELITGRFVAELTGQGVSFQPELTSEGRAPPDRLPRVMDGVVRRSDLHLEVPREVALEGDPSRFESLLQEYVADDTPGRE
jgi:hypothetical protein